VRLASAELVRRYERNSAAKVLSDVETASAKKKKDGKITESQEKTTFFNKIKRTIMTKQISPYLRGNPVYEDRCGFNRILDTRI